MRKQIEHDDYLKNKLWPTLHKKYSRNPIDEKLILFASEKVSAIGENMRPVFDTLSQRGYKCIFIGKFEPPEKDSILNNAEDKYYQTFFSHYSVCKCLFIDDVFKPVYACTPRKGQQVVQLWHESGTLKKWGYADYDAGRHIKSSVVDSDVKHINYTSVSVSAPRLKSVYSSAMNCDESIIHSWGIPKTDVFFNKDFLSEARRELIKNVPNLKSQIGDRKILLYAPSIRDEFEGPFNTVLDILSLKHQLENDYVLLILLRPNPDNIKFIPTEYLKSVFGDFAFDVPSTVHQTISLCGADVLITDYSLSAFDYSLLNRPIILFPYDLHQYTKRYSFFYSYKDVAPGPIVYDSIQLIDAIRESEDNFDYEKLQHFRKKYMGNCDGHSTNRIIHYTVGGEK